MEMLLKAAYERDKELLLLLAQDPGMEVFSLSVPQPPNFALNTDPFGDTEDEWGPLLVAQNRRNPEEVRTFIPGSGPSLPCTACACLRVCERV